jgi:ABC-type transport system substrate-binding protein
MRKKIVFMILGCLVALSFTLLAHAEAPKYGGHLKFGHNSDLTSGDPILSKSGGDQYYTWNIYDMLVGADENMVPKAEFSMSESWEFPTPTTMLFKLRKGIKFHDGTPFNAQAVKFNIDRMKDPNLISAEKSGVRLVERVEIIDEYTLKFHLKQPWGAWTGIICEVRGFPIHSPTAVKKWGEEYPSHAVGTGAFKFAKHVSGSYVTLEKNENYWRKDAAGNQLPFLDKVTIAYIPDEAVRSAALQTGEIDVTLVPPKDVEKFKANPDIKIYPYIGHAVGSLLTFNLSMPPVDNKYLRKAITYAISPKPIFEAVFFGQGVVADAGMWPPGSWAYDATRGVDRPRYDPEKAKEFMKKGGHPNGFEFDIVILNGAQVVQATEMIKAMLAQVGITANIHVFETKTAVQKMFYTREFHAFSTSWSRYPEPGSIAGRNFMSDSPRNAGRVALPGVDDMVNKAAASYNIEERKKLYRKITEIVLDECLYVPFVYTIGNYGYRHWVQNVNKAMTGFDGKFHAHELWLKK